ncbi:MAG TPA: hypothetical protein PLM49_00470, partial [Bacteroidales bacterium]|nr:hypothetical protein [Bacteroidales bacterium]
TSDVNKKSNQAIVACVCFGLSKKNFFMAAKLEEKTGFDLGRRKLFRTIFNVISCFCVFLQKEKQITYCYMINYTL